MGRNSRQASHPHLRVSIAILRAGFRRAISAAAAARDDESPIGCDSGIDRSGRSANIRRGN
jgi:hypothetical protein